MQTSIGRLSTSTKMELIQELLKFVFTLVKFNTTADLNKHIKSKQKF